MTITWGINFEFFDDSIYKEIIILMCNKICVLVLFIIYLHFCCFFICNTLYLIFLLNYFKKNVAIGYVKLFIYIFFAFFFLLIFPFYGKLFEISHLF